MKKIITLILIGVILFGLSGCGQLNMLLFEKPTPKVEELREDFIFLRNLDVEYQKIGTVNGLCRFAKICGYKFDKRRIITSINIFIELGLISVSDGATLIRNNKVDLLNSEILAFVSESHQ